MNDNIPVPVSREFWLEVAKNKISHHYPISVFGRNPDIDQAGVFPIDIWNRGSGIPWIPPTQARVHDLVSDAAADGPAGVGARVVRVFGLRDWDSRQTFEDVVLNGVTPVPTANSYVIIHLMAVVSFGSSGLNAGTITATAQTDGTVTAVILPAQGQTSMAIIGIPSTQTAYIKSLVASLNRTTPQTGSLDIEFHFLRSPAIPDGGDITSVPAGLGSSGTSFIQLDLTPASKVVGPAIIAMKVAGVSADNMDVTGGFGGALIDN